ncbi:MAG: hypothetical protein JXA96_01600 [Sedimentisphaerales bacterium]|nr:hypothetical protein [Sedimentisphaerales bacterium]
MLKIFEKNIHAVWVRCSINLLLKYAGQILIIAGVIAIIAVMTEKLLALEVINSNTLIGFLLFVATAIFAIWFYKQPSKLQISLLLDQRMGLKERFSTALKISDNHDAFSEAACKEALNKAESMNLHGHFPIKLSKGWAYTSTLWLIVVLLFAFMPQKDLLGIQNRRNKENQAAKQKEDAESKVKEATASVKIQMKKINDPNIAEALGKLSQLPEGAKPEEVKRDAIRQLGDLSEKVKNMQKSETLASMKMMQQMLKQLKGSPDSFSSKLRMELAKGNFGQASALLKQMQNEIKEDKLSDEQKKKLSEQMQALSKALEDLAKQSDEFEKELESMGLDKELAKMGKKELKEALQKQGLSSDQIEDLMNKAAASKMARDKLSQMANAMAGSGMGGGAGMSTGDELSDAIEQLDGLEALQQQMMLTEASLNEIARAIGSLGQGMGQGLGNGQGPWDEGDTSRVGNGTGGPGMGTGTRPTDDEGDYDTKKDIINRPPQQGPIIASWYFKDIQVEGETKRDLSEVIQTGRDNAAEAISENEIPRRYEEAIKSYFGNIEQNFPATGDSEVEE